MTFRQMHTGRDFYKYSFFPLAIVQWNALSENVARDLQGSSWRTAASQTLEHCLFYNLFS